MNPLCACGCGSPVTRPNVTLIRGHYSRTEAAKAMYAKRRILQEPPNPSGLCLCGCGQKTRIATVTDSGRHEIAGQPMRYLRGHALRGRRGETANAWKGGRWQHKTGYILIYRPDHPAATKDGYVLEHRLVAEQTIGRYLYAHEDVHHINQVKTDNRPENLQVLTKREHHKLHGATVFKWPADPAARSARSRLGGLATQEKRRQREEEQG